MKQIQRELKRISKLVKSGKDIDKIANTLKGFFSLWETSSSHSIKQAEAMKKFSKEGNSEKYKDAYQAIRDTLDTIYWQSKDKIKLLDKLSGSKEHQDIIRK